jgi:hypothetical protein
MEEDDRLLTEGRVPQAGWLLLGRSELAANIAQSPLPEDWLVQRLATFQPPQELADRIKASLEKVLSQTSVVSGSSRVEVRFYLSKDAQKSRPSKGSWGFFKLVKVCRSGAIDQAVKHVIAYYLYLE